MVLPVDMRLERERDAYIEKDRLDTHDYHDAQKGWRGEVWRTPEADMPGFVPCYRGRMRFCRRAVTLGLCQIPPESVKFSWVPPNRPQGETQERRKSLQ